MDVQCDNIKKRKTTACNIHNLKCLNISSSYELEKKVVALKYGFFIFKI